MLPTTEGGLLLVVCDGMGGMGRGDEASRLAIDVLSGVMSRGEGLPPDRMRHALRAADQRIRDELCSEFEQPGSTAVMVYVLEGVAHVAWVGDSRAYLVRDGRVVYRTRDHKLVEELVDAGQLTPEEARESTLAHVVTRALGGRASTEPPVHPATLGYPWKLRTDDRLLLCSDGVCDLVDDDEISEMIDHTTPAEGTTRLVETALLRGGHDNITCIVAVWDGASWIDDDAATPVIGAGRIAGPPTDSWARGDGDGNHVTEDIDLGRAESPDDPFAELPTTVVDRSSERTSTPRPQSTDARSAAASDARPAATDARSTAVPPQLDVSPRIWLFVGGVLLLLAIAAWIAAATG